MCCQSDLISSPHISGRQAAVGSYGDHSHTMLSLLFFCKQQVFILAMLYFLITAVMLAAWSLSWFQCRTHTFSTENADSRDIAATFHNAGTGLSQANFPLFELLFDKPGKVQPCLCHRWAAAVSFAYQRCPHINRTPHSYVTHQVVPWLTAGCCGWGPNDIGKDKTVTLESQNSYIKPLFS